MKRNLIIRICSVAVFILFMSTNLSAQSNQDKAIEPKQPVTNSQLIVQPPKYKQSPNLVNKSTKKTSSPAYLKAKADFKRTKPNATKQEIAAFVAKWN